MEALREDFRALPGVLALPAPDPAGRWSRSPRRPSPSGASAPIAVAEPVAEQLGLF